MDIYYIPYTKFEIRTELSQNEVLKRISSVLSGKGAIANHFNRDKKTFKGTIGQGSFRISKIINYKNSWNPVLSGKVTEEKAGSVVKVKMRLHPAVLIFSIIWVCGILLMGVSSSPSFEELIWPIGMVTALYVMTFIFFNLAAEQGKDALLELLEN